MTIGILNIGYTGGVASAGGGNATFHPSDYTAVIQGTWVFLDYLMSLNTSNAANDQLDYKGCFSGGTYTATLWSDKDTNRAKAHLLVDGVDKGSFDMYAAAPTANQRTQITGIAIGGGVRTISLKLTDRNASSSGFYMEFVRLSLQRTA